jgi:hypothetical protein
MTAANKKEKKLTMSGSSSRHITKLKQSIILRCLWFHATNAVACVFTGVFAANVASVNEA